MSDLLIKGMEMPKSCGECLFKHLSPTGESIVCELDLSTVPWESKPIDCPLIEVPPHGDLIDRDTLKVQNGWLRDSKYFSQDSSHTHITFVYSNDIFNAPTIIEAEDGE